MSLDQKTRALYSARSLFLESNGSVTGMPEVRGDILASWRRSLLYGLEPERSRPTFGDIGHAEQLVAATRRVVEPRRHHLSDSKASLALTDHTGRLLVRWVEDGSFERRLDHHDVLPGFSFAEATIGTNSGGMVLETGLPALVAGPEHFFEESLQLTCAGAPIRHPVTRRIVGTLNLTCSFDQTSHVLLAWVSDLTREIERCLTESATSREQALLAAYLAANHDARLALVCLDHQTIVSNATASRLLSPADQTLLWERAGRRITSGDPQSEEAFTLSDGNVALMSTEPVVDGGQTVGALVRLRAVPQSEAVSGAMTGRTPPPSPAELPGLVGRSSAWKRMRSDLGRYRGQCIALVGERGSGRTSVAQALMTEEGVERVHIVDASAAGLLGPDTWVTQLSELAMGDSPALLLTHLEAVPVDLVPTVLTALDSALRGGARVIGTCGVHGARGGAPVLEWFEAQVEVPSLAQRTEDVPLLLEELSFRKVGGLRRNRWSSDVVQTVSRVDWPTNVAGLEALVRRVVTGPEMDKVTAAHIPAVVKARASRRRLVGLERIEAQAIMEALDAAQGNKKVAAEALGIARSTLYRKVKALGIDLAGSTF